MTKPILLIDNNDSFTLNIHQILEELGYSIRILSYINITSETLDDYDNIIISPGPGHPNEYNKYNKILEKYSSTKSFLGICLGMQIIGQFFGAKIKKIPIIEHGKKSINIIINSSLLYDNIPNRSIIGRYHSWCLDKNNFPEELTINSIAEDEEIMSISHKKYNIYGVQFHPESYISEYGSKIIENWIKIGENTNKQASNY